MTARHRGTSIPEVLTVTVIIGMLLSAMVVIVPVLAKAPLQMQSQVDNVNTAAIALYKIRRDFAEGNTNGVMGCSTTPVVSCSTLGATPISVQALVVATAEDASGTFKVDPLGNPKWQGFHIYWLVPNSNGTSYDLMRAWEPAGIWTSGSIGPTNVTSGLVNPLVTAAMTISPPPVLTNYISSMQIGINGTSSTIRFQLMAGTTGGADQTQTNFLSNTYARN
jgi:hypothetical protein